MSSSGLLYHYIRGNYKWPRAGDGEPIRSQIGCQPKTNCLLALTEGFYLHNSNPKPKQSALTTPITQLFTSTSGRSPGHWADGDQGTRWSGPPWADRAGPLAAPKQLPALPRGPPEPEGPLAPSTDGDRPREGRRSRGMRRVRRAASPRLQSSQRCLRP